MEEQEDFQLAIHLKKGIFQQQIRKKKIKQLLSERRRKDCQEYQQLQNKNNIYSFQHNGQQLDLLTLKKEQQHELLQDISYQIQMGNLQYMEKLSSDSHFISQLIIFLKNSMNNNENNDDSGDNEKGIKEVLSVFTNLTYHIKSNAQFLNQLAISLYTPQQSSSLMIQEGSCQDNDMRLIEQIAVNYSKNVRMLEYLISLSNNLIFQEDKIIFQRIIESEDLLKVIIDLLKNHQQDCSLIDEISHLVYNITRQKQFYKFEDVNEILFIVYLLLPISNENVFAMNRIIQSLSYALDVASQQQFIDFLLINYHIIEQLFQFIFISPSTLQNNNKKDEETIQIVLELFLLACEIFDDDFSSTTECLHLKKIIWISALNTFQTSYQNAEITIISLKIINSILENTSDLEYFIRNLIEKCQEDKDEIQKIPNALKCIIWQCCEWNNSEIVNEFIIMLCQLTLHTFTLQQILQLVTYGVVYILVESLKTDFLFYEIKDEILQTFIYLFTAIDKFGDAQELCDRIYNATQMTIQQNQGTQIIENMMRSNITKRTQSYVEQILDYLESQVE